MTGKPYRIGIVGAASLAGKELSDALADSALAACDVTLLDAEESAGRITTAGDEPAFIQKIDADSLWGSTLSSLSATRKRRGNIGRPRGWRVQASST